jgi:CRP/FNR family transcriptional regulator, cyclic AMP receptor protein
MPSRIIQNAAVSVGSLTETGQLPADRDDQAAGEVRSKLFPLDEIGWLATQPQSLREWVARSGRWRVFAKGEPLYEVGDEPAAMYGLGRGALEVLIPVSADDQVTIHRAEPGFWIGDSGLLAGTRRVISVVAATRSRVYCIPAGSVRSLLGERSEYWRCFYELAHRNGTLAVATLAEVLSRSPEARLARMLLRLADVNGEIHATQSELARLLGVTRSSLQRALGHLLNDAGLRTGYGMIVIADRAKLQKAVDAG